VTVHTITKVFLERTSKYSPNYVKFNNKELSHIVLRRA